MNSAQALTVIGTAETEIPTLSVTPTNSEQADPQDSPSPTTIPLTGTTSTTTQVLSETPNITANSTPLWTTTSLALTQPILISSTPPPTTPTPNITDAIKILFEGEYQSDEIIVKFDPSFPAQKILEGIAIFGGSVNIDARYAELIKVNSILVNCPKGKIFESVGKYLSIEGVIEAMPNYTVTSLEVIPNDPFFPNQYGLININAPQGWSLLSGLSKVTIAIIDSGVDYGHPDLSGKIFPGYDFVNSDNIAQDDNGHGTHVAGIAAAVGNNNVGIAGVSWGANIIPIKVLDSFGNGSYANVAAGIIWATDNFAQIINLSLGGSATPSTSALQDAINYAYGKGVVVVAASGNSGGEVLFPARYEHVIAVGATDIGNNIAWFSNYGVGIDVVAPGVNIYSTSLGGGYSYSNGTSSSAPFVSGLASLIISLVGGGNPDGIEFIIESSSLDLGTTGFDILFGNGLIQVDKALGLVAQPTPTPVNTPTNDDIDSAKTINEIVYYDTLVTSAATKDENDPGIDGCYLLPGEATVWYKYTAPSDGYIHIDTVGSNYDTFLAVWTGTRGNLTDQACNDDRRITPNDSFFDPRSVLGLRVNSGTTYYIEAGEWEGYQELSVNSTDSPKNVSSQSGGALQLNFRFSEYTIEEYGSSDGWVSPTSPRVLADVNEDGKADIIGFSADGAVVSLGTGSTFEEGQLWEGSFGTNGGWDGTKHIRTMADVDGDGKDDIIGFGDYGVLVSLSTGNGFTPASYWIYGYGAEPAGGGWSMLDNNRYVADVNGDGMADIVGYGLYGVLVSLSNGSSFDAASYWTMGYGKLLGGWDGVQNPRMIADVNGDGCGDVVGFANYGALVSLSNACGGPNTFGAPTYWAYGYAYLLGGWDATRHVRTFADVNNDGKDDLVGFGDYGVLVSLSNGSSLAVAATYWNNGYGYVAGGWDVNLHPRIVVDVDGDLRADVVGFATSGVMISKSNGSSFVP